MTYETYLKLNSEIIRFGIYLHGLSKNNKRIVLSLINLVYPFYESKEHDAVSLKYMLVDYNFSDDVLNFKYYNKDGKIIEEEHVPSILSLIRKEKIKRAFR